MRNAMNEVTRIGYIADCEKGLARWNRIIERAGRSTRLVVPSPRFRRTKMCIRDRLSVEDRVATLALDVDEEGGLRPGYALKLNSYDLGVDIEDVYKRQLPRRTISRAL